MRNSSSEAPVTKTSCGDGQQKGEKEKKVAVVPGQGRILVEPEKPGPPHQKKNVKNFALQMHQIYKKLESASEGGGG